MGLKIKQKIRDWVKERYNFYDVEQSAIAEREKMLSEIEAIVVGCSNSDTIEVNMLQYLIDNGRK